MGWGINSYLGALSLISCLSLAPHLDSEAQIKNRASETDLSHWSAHLCVCVNTRQRTANEILLIQQQLWR